MNKKKLNIILISGVVIIWAILIFKIISYFKITEVQISNGFQKGFPKKSNAFLDTIDLFTDYRDPFQLTSFNLKEEKKSDILIKPINIVTIKSLEWPNITYCGLVRNAKNESFALLDISGKKIITTNNSLIDEIEVVQIYEDSITVQLINEIKTILKK